MLTICLALSFLACRLAAQEAPDPRQEALNRVRTLAQEFDRFKDKQVAAEALTLLGSVTCRYDQSTAAAVLKSAAAALLSSDLDPKAYEKVRAALARSAARCDKSLVEPLLNATLSDKVPPVQSALSTISAASSQIRQDPAHAVDLIRPALDATRLMSNHDARSVGWFLGMLRNQDAAAADSLYLETLGLLAANPDGSLAALQALGNYAFGPIGGTGDMIIATSVGGVGMVHLGQQREGVSNELAAAYLQTAAGILSTPVSSADDQTYRYTLSSQLSAHTERLAPELTATFHGLTEQSGAVVSADVAAQAAERLGKTVEEMRARKPDGRTGDAALLMKSTGHWSEGEFDEARAAASEMKDDDARVRLERVAAFGKALRLASKGDQATAAAVAGALEPALYRSLAFLCLSARQFFEDGLPADAISSLAIAKTEAAKLEPKARPFILLAAAKLEASLDAEAALTTLTVAVTAFNELDLNPEDPQTKPGEPRKSRTLVSPSGVSESLTADHAFSELRLKVERIDGYGFAKSLLAFADVEPERLEAILANLNAERRVAEAQCAAIELRLARALGGQPDSE